MTLNALFYRRTFWFAGLLMILAVAGCGDPTPVKPAGDSAEAGPVLIRALTAWKEGQTTIALQSEEPPIIVRDEDWEAGTKLKDFELVGMAVQYGGDWRVDALLTLDNGSEPVRVAYTVTVAPTLNVLRMDHPD